MLEERIKEAYCGCQQFSVAEFTCIDLCDEIATQEATQEDQAIAVVLSPALHDQLKQDVSSPMFFSCRSSGIEHFAGLPVHVSFTLASVHGALVYKREIHFFGLPPSTPSCF